MRLFLLRHFAGPLIHDGTLTIVTPSGRVERVGSGSPDVTVELANWRLLWRTWLDPDLAVGEAYMDGSLKIRNGDIHDFLALCMSNSGLNRGLSVQRILCEIRDLWHRLTRLNPLPRAQANVAHHYDLSDELYELFLDADRQYSCGYFLSPSDTLDEAQEQKKRYLAAKLLLTRGQRVLDIGCGWGGLALHLARSAKVEVTGITLSAEQCSYASRRAEAEGLAGRAEFLLHDFHTIAGRYDRIVSVGMFEHVAFHEYRRYFEKIRDLLAPDGVAVVHTIGTPATPGGNNPWMQKYIFPGGRIPALSEIVSAIERAGLFITDIEVLRLHYARTLAAWRSRFDANRRRIAELYDERFCRMWEFYLAACEVAFRLGGLVVFQIQLAKRIDTVPLTRAYLGRAVEYHESMAAE